MIGCRRGGSIDAHADDTAEQKISGEAGGPGGRYVPAERHDLRFIAFLLEGDRNVGVRLTTTEHGVVQVVGTSIPLTTASTPDGVDEMLMFSVVPRVTDAQPPSMTLSATIPNERMKCPLFPALMKRNREGNTSLVQIVKPRTSCAREQQNLDVSYSPRRRWSSCTRTCSAPRAPAAGDSRSMLSAAPHSANPTPTRSAILVPSVG